MEIIGGCICGGKQVSRMFTALKNIEVRSGHENEVCKCSMDMVICIQYQSRTRR